MSPQKYEIHTTVDITNTQDTNPKGNSKSYLQMQNLSSILQVLGMRAQPLYPHVVKDKSVYFGNHTTWILRFDCDIQGAWQKGENNVYFIEHDLHRIPVYSGLDETIDSEYLDTQTENKNTHNETRVSCLRMT